VISGACKTECLQDPVSGDLICRLNTALRMVFALQQLTDG